MRKQRPRVEIVSTGKKMTLKQFKKNSTKLLVENSVTKKEIIDSKILNRKEFDAFVIAYNIPVTTRNHSEYIDKDLFLKSLIQYQTKNK